MIKRGHGATDPGSMKFWIVVAALAVIAWRGGVFAAEIDDSMLEASFADPCAAAERCVAVYLTPWCPQCQRSIPLVHELRARAARSGGRVGVKVVVGQDQPKKLEKYARKVGGEIYFDGDGSFYSQIGGGVPAWVTWDRSGRVHETLNGAPYGASEDVLMDVLARELALSEHL